MSQTSARYTVQYDIRDLSVPGLVRRHYLTGRSRRGIDETVTFRSFAAAENAASVQRSQKGVLRAYVLPVREAR